MYTYSARGAPFCQALRSQVMGGTFVLKFTILRSRARSRRRAEDGSTMHDAMQVAAAALLGFFLQGGEEGAAHDPDVEHVNLTFCHAEVIGGGKRSQR